MKLTEKEVRESFGIKSACLPDEQKKFIDSIVSGFTDAINKSNEGVIDSKELELKLKEFGEQMASRNLEALKELQEENQNLTNLVKSQGEAIEKLKQEGVSMKTINKFDTMIDDMLNSDKFQDFASGRTRKSGTFEGFSLKDAEDTVSMTDNYTGTHLIAQQLPVVANPYAPKPLHIRQLIKVLHGDPNSLTLYWTQVDSFDRNARYVTENGRLPKSSISFKEKSSGTTRLGTHIPISKRMLKSRTYVRSFILQNLPEAVYMAEDWNMLFGDGSGENLLGIVNYEGVTSVEAIVSEAITEGSAGSIKSVTPYNEKADAMVEFTNPQPIVRDGMMLTLTGAETNTNLNGTYPIVKVNDRQVLLVGVSMTEEEAKASVDKMTFKVNNSAFKSIEIPNSEDVVNTAFAVMMFGEYYPTLIVLNPITVNAIGAEKDAVGRSLELIKTVGGVKYIAGHPIVEYSGIPAGKYLLGDFKTAANLVDYTSMTLEWAEDVETKLTNRVVLIAQEEVIFPVIFPWAFAYGDLNQLKAAITKSISSGSGAPSTTTTTTTTTTTSE